MGQATALREFFALGGAETVRWYLGRQADVEAAALHANHWRPVLLRALAAHTEFSSGGFQAVLPHVAV